LKPKNAQTSRRRSIFSVTTLFASFFGAAMVAGAFAYFNYKFSEYKFVNFDEWIFYTQKDIFVPTQERYMVIFYSSKMGQSEKFINKLNSEYPILAIDMYQREFKNTTKVQYLRSGTNTVLKTIQRFNIYQAPTVFIIKRFKDSLYKQDSMIQKLENLAQLKDVE